MDSTTEYNLIQIIDYFGQDKETLDTLKKSCDENNKKIKEIMSSEGLEHYNTSTYSATYKVKQTTKVNEEKLLYLLQTIDGDNFRKLGIIQTKEYIDSDALESAIFNGIFDPEMLRKIQECSTVVKTPTLTVKRKGK